MGMVDGFFGDWNFRFREIWQGFFGWLDFWVFETNCSFLVVPVYPAANTNIQFLTYFLYVIIYCFVEILRTLRVCMVLYFVPLYFLLVQWVQDNYNNVSWRSVQAFTNDPLHIQFGQEYFIELVKYKFQGRWFTQFKIQYTYQLKIKGPQNIKRIKILGDRAFGGVGPSL